MKAVTDRLFPLTEWSSIDEFYADTTDLQTLHPDPLTLGLLVKQAIFDSTALRCTVGVATGKTIAKIAADSHKPDGLAVVPPGTEAEFLRGDRSEPYQVSDPRLPRAWNRSGSKQSVSY